MRLIVLAWLLAPALTCAPRTEGPHDPAVAPDSLRVTATTSQVTYGHAEAIDLSLVVENRTARPVTIEFASGQRYDFLVLEAAGDTVWRWAADKAFIQVLGQAQLEAHESLEFLATVEIALRPGSYTLVGRLTSRSHPLEGRARFTVR